MSSAFWQFGWAPDKILQHTKDHHIVTRLVADVQNIITKVVGAGLYEHYAPEFEVMSQLLYFCATRVGGRQTLGEEYTDLQVVVATPITTTTTTTTTATSKESPNLTGLAVLGSVHLPSLRRLGIFAALSIGVPYLYERLQRASATAARNTTQARHTNSVVVSNSILQRFQCTLMSMKRTLLSTFWSTVASCLHPTSAIAVMATFIYQCHRMLFFFRSDYLSLPMRLTGMKQIVNRELTEGRASYSILGMLLLVRMIVGASRSTHRAAIALLQYLRPANTTMEQQKKQRERTEQKTLNLLVPSFSTEESKIEGAGGAGELRQRGGRALQCLLCTEQLQHPTLTPCGHLFCWDCVVPWCSKRSTCPLCRQTSLPQQLWLVQFSLLRGGGNETEHKGSGVLEL